MRKHFRRLSLVLLVLLGLVVTFGAATSQAKSSMLKVQTAASKLTATPLNISYAHGLFAQKPSARAYSAFRVSKSFDGMAAPRTITLPAKALDTAPAPRVNSPHGVSGVSGVSPFDPVTTFLSDGFEGPFAWQTGYFNDAYWITTWGPTINRASVGSYSAYCAMVNSPIAGYYYPDNMDGFMYSGPFNFTSSTAANLNFDVWLDTELYCDFFKIYYSYDGTTFTQIGAWSGYSNGWVHMNYDASSTFCGHPQVWLMFRFSSDSSNIYEGAYVDQVSLTEVIPDTTPPTTTISGLPATSWTNSPVALTFTATDNTGGSGMSGGLAKTEYELDTGAWTTGTTLTISTDGIHTVNYRSTDAAGNVEASHTATVRVDASAPRTSALAKVTVKKGKKATLKFKVTDVTPQAKVTIRIYKGNKLKKTLAVGSKSTNSAQTYKWTCNLPKGAYTWKVYATDLAGNAQNTIGKNALVVK